jgi:hypothetical protein
VGIFVVGDFVNPIFQTFFETKICVSLFAEESFTEGTTKKFRRLRFNVTGNGGR